MEKLNITQGKWEVSQKLQVQVDIESPLKVSTLCQVYGYSDEAKHNAILISDAGTTYNTTPILPSVLLKQRNELKLVLENLVYKCLHTDGYNQKYQELYDAQQVLQNCNNA